MKIDPAVIFKCLGVKFHKAFFKEIPALKSMPRYGMIKKEAS